MKKSIVYLITLLFLTMGVAGCSKDSEEEKEPTLQNYNFHDFGPLIRNGVIPTRFMEVKEFPEWIQKGIESLPNYFKPLWIFQFNWKGSTHYLIYYTLMSGPYDCLYTQSGEKLDGRQLWDEIRATSYDWTLVYESLP